MVLPIVGDGAVLPVQFRVIDGTDASGKSSFPELARNSSQLPVRRTPVQIALSTAQMAKGIIRSYWRLLLHHVKTTYGPSDLKRRPVWELHRLFGK